MKIKNTNPISYKTMRNENKPYTFEDLQLAEDKDGKGKKGKFETRRENGYISQYIIKQDGSKILISEIKESKTEISSEKAKRSAQQSNTKYLMDLLATSASANTPIKIKPNFKQK
ncbi:hypothetical protein [Bacillus sp. REN10]|uniref:hypothetical protein n=1 Tax=Bacillus sp. REN10 TaxID=2782541 RepID=UPI00193BF63A|nr:hypothetical protein [Bacillus sp. REN10]